MAKDFRLDPKRYVSYTADPFLKKKQLNYDDLFSPKASTWTLGRFETDDLTKRVKTRTLQLNPGLNFIGETPEEYEVFAGIGRFTRKEGYDFETGRPNTTNRPETQPGFSEIWKEAYDLSPTVSPEKRVSNPMPRVANPDPKGYLMAAAEKKAENEIKDNKSVAQLLKEKTGDTEEQKKEDLKTSAG